MLLVHQNTGKGNRYRKLSVPWGDLIEQIKKVCHIHFKTEVNIMDTNKDITSAI